MCGPDGAVEIILVLLGGIAAGVLVGVAIAAKVFVSRIAAWRALAKVWRDRFNHATDERDSARRELQEAQRAYRQWR